MWLLSCQVLLITVASCLVMFYLMKNIELINLILIKISSLKLLTSLLLLLAADIIIVMQKLYKLVQSSALKQYSTCSSMYHHPGDFSVGSSHSPVFGAYFGLVCLLWLETKIEHHTLAKISDCHLFRQLELIQVNSELECCAD